MRLTEPSSIEVTIKLTGVKISLVVVDAASLGMPTQVFSKTPEKLTGTSKPDTADPEAWRTLSE